MEKLHTKFLQRAIELSEQGSSRGVGGPFGAVIVKDGQIIVEAVNEVTSSCDPTAHAEVQAIRKAGAFLKTFNLQGCTIYSSCEPCPMCLSAIYWARMDAVYFANTRDEAAEIDFDDAFLYDELAKAQHDRRLPVYHLPSLKAKEVFEKWAKSAQKVPY
ncbi:MAG: nucleoside deaminase [Bacteroidia bacterium]